METAIMQDARAWAADCVADPEEVFAAPAERVKRWVDRMYEGGWEAFENEFYAALYATPRPCGEC